MRPLLLVCVGALVIPIALSSTSTPAGGPPALAGETFGLFGGCGPQEYGPWLWECYFSVWVSSPNLIFFRWDFEGDGVWDTPWVSIFSLTHQSSQIGVARVTVQGWDGISTRDGEPIGPVAFKDIVLGGGLEFGPDEWSRLSAGWVFVGWEFPSDFQPPAGRPVDAKVFMVIGSAGVSAIALPRPPHPGLEPSARFRVDRSTLSQVLGPGTHAVFIWGRWGSYDFTTLPTDITIL